MNILEIDSTIICRMLLSAYNLLNQSKEVINDMNVFPVPDGDTGTNMTLTLKEAVDALKESDKKNMSVIAKCISNGVLMGARGNSGVILSQLIRGFMNNIKNKEKLDAHDISLALDEGLKTAYKAVLKPKEGTILTVAREIAKASYVFKKGDDIHEMLTQLIIKGDNILSKTPDMLPILKQAGVVDAGGMGLMTIFKGAVKGLENETLEDSTEFNEKTNESKHPVIYDNDIKFVYCTEFIVNNKFGKNIKNELKQLGDSFIYVEGDGIIKVHIHTNNPDKVLGYALKLGEVIKVKIENMKEQHTMLLEDNVLKKYGIISIVNGSGFEKIYNELGTDLIINGGQTMNPSTQVIVDALNKINAENIFILPNNVNIFLAAKQAAEIISKNVYVIQSKTIPQGIMALIAFNEDASIEENLKNMNSACLDVKTGEITNASKNTKINEIEIKKGQIIALIDGNIIAVSDTVYEATVKLLEKVLESEINYINIYYGKNANRDISDKIKSYLESYDIEFEILYGGQDLYDYIISIC